VIGVEITNRRIMYDGHTYSNGWWLRDEVSEWLWANVGSGSSCGGHRDGDVWWWTYVWDEKPTQNAIVFTDPNAALLFKLTWGGN
jgi:hypothetical protein